MHDDGIMLSQLQPRRRHLIVRDVIHQANLLAGEAFLLQAQQHAHIRPAQRFFNMACDAKTRRKSGRDLGHELGRTAERNLHSELRQQVAGGARHAAVEDITNDRDLQALE